MQICIIVIFKKFNDRYDILVESREGCVPHLGDKHKACDKIYGFYG